MNEPGGAPAVVAPAVAIAVRVRLHGPAANPASQRELVVALPVTATTESLWDVLVTRLPALDLLRAQCALAIDNEWVGKSARLHEGAVVDVIPPVSGG